MSDAITASELVKTYPPEVRALDGLSLSVPAGTIFALLGPNGAGKSTTVRVLTTLSRPDSGNARVAGIDVVAEPMRARRAIGVVGQKHGADGEATGRENMILQGEFYGTGGRALRGRVAESLERFGLTEAADRRVKTYSGGMQRRLDVALGLIHRPAVLFLDEPTTGLDPEVRAQMWEEIEYLAREEGLTVLITTHYLEEADRLASQVAIVDHGRVVASGAPETLKSELEGDTIHLELAEGDGHAVRAALAELRGVSAASIEGASVHVHAREGAAAVPAVLAALEERGVRASSLTLARPSLDEVYLRHTGRRFGAAQDARSGESNEREVAA
jgi:ABC-2 type transport system ATP-binding protein